MKVRTEEKKNIIPVLLRYVDNMLETNFIGINA